MEKKNLKQHGARRLNGFNQPSSSGLSLAENFAANRPSNENYEGGVRDVISNVDRDILVEQKAKIEELIQIKNILELKTEKMKQLLRIKDQKIHALQQKLAQFQQRTELR